MKTKRSSSLDRDPGLWLTRIFLLVLVIGFLLFLYSGHRDRAVIRNLESTGQGAPSVSTILPDGWDSWCPDWILPWFERVTYLEIYESQGTAFQRDFSGLHYLEEVSYWGEEESDANGAFDFSNCPALRSVFMTTGNGDFSFSGCLMLKELIVVGWGDLSRFPDLTGCASLVELSILARKVDTREVVITLPNLTSLTLYIEPSDEFPDFSQCLSLTALHLHTQKEMPIPDLSPWHETLISLTLLCEWKEVPELKSFLALRSLELGYFNTNALPDLRPLERLNQLTLSELELEEAPKLPTTLLDVGLSKVILPEIPELPKHLHRLHLLGVSPDALMQWEQELTLGHFRFNTDTETQTRFAFFEHLTITDTFSMSGGALTAEMCQNLFAGNLSSLKLWWVEIEELPVLTHFPLETLEVSYCPLRAFYPTDFPKSLKKVEFLGLEKITRIPVLNLPNLKEMDLSKMNLAEDPVIFAPLNAEITLNDVPISPTRPRE